MYTGTIAYRDGKIENITIDASDYLEAMRLFHKTCNARINIGHETITQTLLVEKVEKE